MNISFNQRIGTEPQVAAIDELRRIECASAEKRHAARADDARADVNADQVHEIFIPRRRVHFGSALDEQRFDAEIRQALERRPQRRPLDGFDSSPSNGIVYSSAFSVGTTTTVRYRAYDQLGDEEAIGQHDDDTGQAIVAFVTLQGELEGGEATIEEIRAAVAERIGKFARPKRIIWADDLPKTRSGKIMRRLLRDIAEGRALGDVTTLRDPAVMEQLEEQITALRAQED